ncbi:hypothetical protein EMCRGX_G033628 [Ephydatia muelleri]
MLQKSSKVLYGPGQQPLEVMGQFTSNMIYNGLQSEQVVFVMKELKKNLLGLLALTALQLVSREKLARMESLGVITKVEGPSEWCCAMVVVPKKDNTVHICVDLKPLNENVQRENFPLPKVDETLPQLAEATAFSKIDANSGFWQIPLAKESHLLPTFITPFGRYCFTKLPFGISSAPELFQRRMDGILSGLDGILCHMDNVLIFGSSQGAHDCRLQAALQRIGTSGVTLNPNKCIFSKHKMTFLGHIVSQQGICADPEKSRAILNMPNPKDISELRRFLGIINQFSPNLSDLSRPLRDLLSSRKTWLWGPAHDQAFHH